MANKNRPPEPADDFEAENDTAQASLGLRLADRVTLSIKVTDKMGDAFVGTEVGFSSSLRPGETTDRAYERVAATVNKMYSARRAEVRAALGVKTTKPAR